MGWAWVKLLFSLMLPGAGLLVDKRTRNEGFVYLFAGVFGWLIWPLVLPVVAWLLGLIRTAVELDKERAGGRQ